MDDKNCHCAKEVLDSSLGQLGTVGVLAVQDFMATLKSVFQKVLTSQSQMPSGSSRRVSEWGQIELDSIIMGAAASGSSTVSRTNCIR